MSMVYIPEGYIHFDLDANLQEDTTGLPNPQQGSLFKKKSYRSSPKSSIGSYLLIPEEIQFLFKNPI